ncbi:MAG: hypothetical protein LBP98_00225 [Tannerella sp.]|jgi:hypothetical protein|nr:hypothetical protein [Tannerella sp.]
MNLFKYSKQGACINLIAALFAFMWIPPTIDDGFRAGRLDAASKGASLMMAGFYILFGVIALTGAISVISMNLKTALISGCTNLIERLIIKQRTK